MRAFWSVVTFTRQRAVQLEDTGRVACAGIDLHPLVIKEIAQREQAALDELAAFGVIGQVDSVGQVRAIATVRED